MRSALQLSKRVQAQGEAKPKQKSSLLYPPFSFLRERKGVLLTKRRPFLSQTLSYPTARSRGAIALSRRTFFKFAFLWSGSRRVKFDFKFERIMIRQSIFLLRYARSFSRSSRRGAFKFGDGSYHVGNDRAKFKSLCLQLRPQGKQSEV